MSSFHLPFKSPFSGFMKERILTHPEYCNDSLLWKVRASKLHARNNLRTYRDLSDILKSYIEVRTQTLGKFLYLSSHLSSVSFTPCLFFPPSYPPSLFSPNVEFITVTWLSWWRIYMLFALNSDFLAQSDSGLTDWYDLEDCLC